VRFLLVLLLWLFSTTVSAQTVEPDDLRLELSFEERSGPLYTGEMILLKIRGFYKIRVARETLRQSDLDGFDWMQLGEDKWSKDTSQGGEILQYERVIALFPNRVGLIDIQPFVHELELWTQNGRRFEHQLKSDTLSIEVTERPPSEDWWLPVRQIRVDDRWSNSPDKLGTGEGALRVVTLTVEGTLPEQVPPMPELGSAGAFVFPHPEVRMTRLYRRGPVTRVFWRWTVRPENPPSAYLKPVRIPYFDTKLREHREILLAAQRIAMTEEAVASYLAEANADSVVALLEKTSTSDTAPTSLRGASMVMPFGLLVGFIVGFTLLMSGKMRDRRWTLKRWLPRFRPDADLTALKYATASDDTAAARQAIVRLIGRGQGDVASMRNALLDIDRVVFGRLTSMPDLKRIEKEIRDAVRTQMD